MNRAVPAIALIGVIATAALSGCGDASSSATTSSALDGSYVVTAIDGTPATPGSRVTATIDGSRVFGRGGCNAYSVDLGEAPAPPAPRNTLTATAAACADRSVMDQETRFLTTLALVAQARADGGNVQLLDTAWSTRITLTPDP